MTTRSSSSSSSKQGEDPCMHSYNMCTVLCVCVCTCLIYACTVLGHNCSPYMQHDNGLGLIEENEIHSNALAGVWITTGTVIAKSV